MPLVLPDYRHLSCYLHIAAGYGAEVCTARKVFGIERNRVVSGRQGAEGICFHERAGSIANLDAEGGLLRQCEGNLCGVIRRVWIKDPKRKAIRRFLIRESGFSRRQS